VAAYIVTIYVGSVPACGVTNSPWTKQWELSLGYASALHHQVVLISL